MNSLLLIPISSSSNRAVNRLLIIRKTNGWSLVKLKQPLSTSSWSQQQQQQQQSEGPKKGGSGFKLFALALTGFTVGIGYVTLNPDSRRQIESYVPQSQYLFDYVDGLLKNVKGQIPSFSSQTPSPSSASTTSPSIPPPPPPAPIVQPKQPASKPAEAKPSVEKKPITSTPQPLKEVAPAPLAAASQTEAAKSEPVLKEKKAEKDLDWKKHVKEFDLQEEATVNAIETRLRTLNESIRISVQEALNSSYVAIESLNKYKAALKAALDDSKDHENEKEVEWRKVTDLFDVQTNNVNVAHQKFALAKSQIEELDRLLAEIKSDELSKNVKNLKETQLELIKQFRAFQAEQNKLSEAIIHANVLKSYTTEQKIARNQFLKEMQALMPEGIHGINKSHYGEQLTNEELNSLLIHAHKRVIQLQKQIEKIQTTQNQQIQSALDEQRRQNAELKTQNEINLYSLHRKEFELEKDKIIESERENAKEELRKELARQAAAHNNHLAQMLKLQEQELALIYEKKLIFEKEKARDEFNAKVSEGLGRLKGIEAALNARANLELQANNAKQLWLAVQNLAEILASKSSDLDPSGSAYPLVKIDTTLNQIETCAPDNHFIQTIIESIPKSSIADGVWSEPDLKERFGRLKRTAQRVALIDERGGSLFKYFISYLQSYFIFAPRLDPSLERPEEVRVDELERASTFGLLAYAEYYVERGEWENAVRVMQLLRGEPGRLARDWIRDAVQLVEIRQACQLLSAYISSVYIGTNFN